MYIGITKPDFFDGEAEWITLLFQAGLQRLHIRKPNSTEQQRIQLLNNIPDCYHHRIILGEKLMDENSSSCHSLTELEEKKNTHKYQYLSLSPIFDSISKEGYHSRFTHEELIQAHKNGLIDENTIALGGICRENIDILKQYGFGHQMVLGDLWVEQKLPIVLSIAGSDPSAGAGIQQDLKTITNHGCYGTTVITSITTQNTLGVISQMPVPASVVESQIKAIFADLRVDCVKIGIIPNLEVAKALVAILKEERRKRVLPIVYDPILFATSGCRLIDENTIDYIKEQLFPLCTLITPNIPEYEILHPEGNILIKGGHSISNIMTDKLWLNDEKRYEEYTSERIETKNLHGTGCTLSSAIASNIAKKKSLTTAVGNAKDYINKAILGGKDLCIGHGNGPLWV